MLANVLKAPACARAFVSGNRSQAYLRAVSTKVKVVFRLVPRVPTAVMMATEIADGDKRYSMAVAPLASWANLASSLVRNLHLCRGSYVLVVTSMNKRNLLFGTLIVFVVGIAALAGLPNVKQVEKRGPIPPAPVAAVVTNNIGEVLSAIHDAFNNWSDLVAGLNPPNDYAQPYKNKFPYGSHWSRFYLFSRDDPVFPSDEQILLTSGTNPSIERYAQIPADRKSRDLYLNEPSGDQWWMSEYFVDGQPANFCCSFLIHLEPAEDTGTRIEIFEYQPTIWAGEKFGFSAHGLPVPTRLHDIRVVDSTTMDRDEVLRMIQDALATQSPEKRN